MMGFRARAGRGAGGLLAFWTILLMPYLAWAQDDTAPAPTPNRPALVREALAAGDPVSETAWAFTQALANDEGEILLRYDPREEGEAWTLLSPPAEDAPKEVIGILEGIRKAQRGSEVLGYENLSTVLGDAVTLAREEADAMIYRFEPTKPPKGQARGRAAGFLDKLRGELTIRRSGAGEDGADPWIEVVRLFAPEPFKPNLAARITRFEQTAHYNLRDGLPLLRESNTAVAGSALFSDFEESVTVRIIEAEPIVPVATASGDPS